jgi:hypothetical protein
MTQFSDGVNVGNAFYGAASSVRGFALPNSTAIQYGTVAATTSNAIVDTYTATQATTLSATGTLVSGGVATFDVPRNVQIAATGALSAYTFTITGTDQYKQAQTETVLGPTGATFSSGNKAFKTVTSITCTGAVSQAVSVGTGSKIGLPFRLNDLGGFTNLIVEGVQQQSPTIVAALSTTSASTSATADVRGTFTSTTAPNGSLHFTVEMLVTPDTQTNLYGVAPA